MIADMSLQVQGRIDKVEPSTVYYEATTTTIVTFTLFSETPRENELQGRFKTTVEESDRFNRETSLWTVNYGIVTDNFGTPHLGVTAVKIGDTWYTRLL